MTALLDEILVGIRGVLFDMDGVLLDTEAMYTEATQRVLGPLARKYTFEVKQKLMGRAPLVAAEILLAEVGSPMTPAEYNLKKKPILDELFRRSVATRGAEELVTELRSRGLPMAVATSSDRSYFQTKTAHHAWFSMFDAVVCGSDPEVELHKPAPDIFLAAARKLSIAPSECLVFEDSPAGVEAAHRAQVARIVAVPDARLDHSLIPHSHFILDGFSPLLAP